MKSAKARAQIRRAWLLERRGQVKKPVLPDRFTLRPLKSGDMKISWSEVSASYEGLALEYLNGENWEVLYEQVEPSGAMVHFTHEGLKPAAEYSYRLRAGDCETAVKTATTYE